MSAIYDVVQREADKIDSSTVAIVAGSYRRGHESSGDVDVLISHSEKTELKPFFLHKLIQSLHKMKFLTDDLTGKKGLKKSVKSYMGVCRLRREHVTHDFKTVLSGVYRRIDIKYYHRSSLPFALLYFTGSDHFNRSMRFYAKKCCSLSLTNTRLVEDTGCRDADDRKIGREVPCESEREIFAALGLVYREPKQRNCYGVEAGKYNDLVQVFE